MHRASCTQCSRTAADSLSSVRECLLFLAPSTNLSHQCSSWDKKLIFRVIDLKSRQYSYCTISQESSVQPTQIEGIIAEETLYWPYILMSKPHSLGNSTSLLWPTYTYLKHLMQSNRCKRLRGQLMESVHLLYE